MKLSDYRNKVWESYPDSFMDYDSTGLACIYGDSSRSAILSRGKTPLLAWQSAYFTHVHIPSGEQYSDDCYGW